MYPPGDVIHSGRANDSVTLEELNEELFELNIPALIFVALCMMVGLIGNTLVFTVYKKKFRRSNHRYFILFLAGLDFLACATGMPFLIASLRLPYLMPDAKLCKSFRYIHYLVNNASGLLLLVISIERFRKICFPFKRQLTHRHILYLCYGTIFFSAVIAIPAAIFYGSSEINMEINNLTGHQCYVDESQKDSVLFELYQALLLSETLLCIVIFAILYAFIVRRLVTSDQFLQAMRSMQMTSSNRSNETSFSTDMDQDPKEESSDSKFAKSLDENCDKLLMNNREHGSESRDMIQQSQSVDNIKRNNENSQGGTKSLWRGSRELFKRKENKDVQLGLTRSMSDTKLHKVKQQSKFSSLTPTERLVVGKMLKSTSVASSKKSTKSRSSRTTARVTLMLWTVSIVFAIAFIPHLVLMIITIQDEEFLRNLNSDELIAYQVFLRSFILNNVANPVIYLFFDTKFRQQCKMLCSRKSQ